MKEGNVLKNVTTSFDASRMQNGPEPELSGEHLFFYRLLISPTGNKDSIESEDQNRN